MSTPHFTFLDVINYLGPRVSYEKWVKTYDCEATKSWFPFEWFDSVKKLNFPELPEYESFYSSFKGEIPLTR